MSKADEIFKQTCSDILNNGTKTEGENVRAHWPDGTPAYTIKKFGVINRYDLRKEFPISTLRQTYLKSAMDEILWIYQKTSNNINDLHSHIWDEWADKSGSIGRAYGYQIGSLCFYNDITEDGIKNAFPNIRITHGKTVSYASIKTSKMLKTKTIAIYQEGIGWSMDQMAKVIYDLKNNPFSRRIMTNMWNVSELKDMNLQPCAYSMTYNVTRENNKLVLNAILNQRSQDMLAANGWNVSQYALLLMMVAQVCDMVAGELIHVIADAHIYDKHVPIIEELIQRTDYSAPKVTLDPEITNFYDFTADDLIVENYNFGKQVKIPIAI